MNIKNIKNYRDLFLTINRLFYQVVNKHKTALIMDEDWDNLIILDACRYDMFKDINKLQGELDYIYSKGSSTGHFLQENFKGNSYFDTVYVTANPTVNYYVPHSFFQIIPVWKDGWHEPYQTVLPATMVEFSLQAFRQYTDKRFIFHFMQPHFPFIGEKGREKIGDHDGVFSRNLLIGQKVEHTQTVWQLFKAGILKRETVWDAYVDNLEIVLKAVEKLLETLSGKTVITSDHANLFGEWLWPIPIKEYGHSGGIYKKSAIKVPWFVVEKGNRRTIKKTTPEVPSEKQDFDEEEYKKKLESLGYLS